MDTGESIHNDEFAVEVAVYNEEYTQNEVTIFYYRVPKYSKTIPNEVPSNINDTVMIPADFLIDNQSTDPN